MYLFLMIGFIGNFRQINFSLREDIIFAYFQLFDFCIHWIFKIDTFDLVSIFISKHKIICNKSRITLNFIKIVNSTQYFPIDFMLIQLLNRAGIILLMLIMINNLKFLLFLDGGYTINFLFFDKAELLLLQLWITIANF